MCGMQARGRHAGEYDESAQRADLAAAWNRRWHYVGRHVAHGLASVYVHRNGQGR